MNIVLAAIDFSPVSRSVVAQAIALARATAGRVVLFNAVQPPQIVTEVAPLVGEALQVTAEVERASRQHLRRWAQAWAKRGVEIETVCRQGFAVPLIVALAKQLEARYLVLGSHGHTAFYDLVAGSTASGVLKRAACPVVLVPAAAKKPRQRNARRRQMPRPRGSANRPQRRR